jgi:predicted transposase/invertase (TIGR01784 family)
MANHYDKIIKENLEELLYPLVEQIIGLNLEELEEIPDELQRTIERKPDFLKRVNATESSYILHLEFQVANDREMHYRMLEYKSMLLRKYELDVQQYVFYIGNAKMRMKNEISLTKLKYSYQIVDLSEIPYEQFLEANEPEAIILGILGNFGESKETEVITKLLNRLKTVPLETSERSKYVVQLEILSSLRNLQTEVIHQIGKIMALKYNIKEDLRYKEGLEDGLEKGVEEGKLAERKKLIIQLLKSGKLSAQEIAESLEVEFAEVEAIQKELEQ